MRLRNVTGSAELIARSRYVCGRPEAYRGKWNSFFQNENPIHIEIGMGKGKFITGMAGLHPEINYIGIEKYSSVVYRAVQRLERMVGAAGEAVSALAAEEVVLEWTEASAAEEVVSEMAGAPAAGEVMLEMAVEKAVLELSGEDGERAYPNLIFLCMDAREITKIFGVGEIGRIYLNFSDPWPKDRHAGRRLPSRSFLSLYREILAKDGCLEFKTDNEGLFRFALEELEPAGWQADRVTFDLHHDLDMLAGNVMTEYEEKFAALGNPIFKYIISRKPGDSEMPENVGKYGGCQS